MNPIRAIQRSAPGGLRPWAVAGLAAVLCGCGPGLDLSDLQSFTENALENHEPRIDPPPEIEPDEIFLYTAQDLTDPFLPLNLRDGQEPLADETAGDEIFEPERRRDALEQFPLDSLAMHGTLRREEHIWALVRAPDGGVHRVTLGDYLGQNNGKIIDVSEGEIMIREVVKSHSGRWQERKAALPLIE